jgi:hypothetical protein
MKNVATRIKDFFTGSSEFRRKMDELQKRKSEMDLDGRLDRVAHATLNGDTEWFYSIMQKNPTCILKAIRECVMEEDKK